MQNKSSRRSRTELAEAPLIAHPDGLKTCYQCKQAKPIAEFHRNRANLDGLLTYCKPCFLVKASANRKPAKSKAARRL